MKLDYVDIFYHHRMDTETPLEETMTALADIVRSGKALYAGVSNYNKEYTEKAVELLREQHCPFIVNQRRYSIFDRTIEKDGVKVYCREAGVGIIAFSPLAQMALSWVLKDDEVCSVLIGASRPEQIVENIAVAEHADFTGEELKMIEEICTGLA